MQQGNRVLPREHIWQTPSSNNTREDSTHEHHQVVNTEIRLIIFFAARDGTTEDEMVGWHHQLNGHESV